ncbi:unnamed protein product [Mucor hiemalis]
MRTFVLCCLALIFAASVVFAAEDGSTDYIVGLSKPVTDEKIKRAKKDIEKSGGKVKFEITLGMQGLVVSFPSDLVQALESKDYVDFIEEDKLVHALQN